MASGRNSKKNPTAAEKRHMSRVASLGCIACRNQGDGETPASVHHALTGGGGRRNHMKVLPLCHYHHQGEGGIHTLSRNRWQEIHGTEEELLEQVAFELAEIHN